MNKKVPFILMSISAVLLTACDSKIKKERFTEQLSATKANISFESETLDDVHIAGDKLGFNQTNYKKGEFYSKVSGLILSRNQEYTWKAEDGKYYHYEKNLLVNVDKEITKEEFDVYMENARYDVFAELNKGISETEKLMSEEAEEYYDIQNSYIRTASGEYKFSSTMKYKAIKDGVEEEATRKVTFYMKKNLPVKYVVKTDGESTYKYTYGKAEFTEPNRGTNS